MPLHAATTTRLLVDLNRSIGHRQLFSEVTRALPRARRQDLVDRHYRPHRHAVEADMARLVATGQRVLHVASHSFTPMLGNVLRRADVAWLYDPRRPGEVAFARAWMREFAQLAPGLRLRRNYPYRGRERRPDGSAAQAISGRVLRGNRAGGQPVARRSARPLGPAEGRAHRLTTEGARRRIGERCSGGRAGARPTTMPRTTTPAGASSWNTLRVPSSHCRVSASK